jgi:hypothetical protein
MENPFLSIFFELQEINRKTNKTGKSFLKDIIFSNLFVKILKNINTLDYLLPSYFIE